MKRLVTSLLILSVILDPAAAVISASGQASSVSPLPQAVLFGKQAIPAAAAWVREAIVRPVGWQVRRFRSPSFKPEFECAVSMDQSDSLREKGIKVFEATHRIFSDKELPWKKWAGYIPSVEGHPYYLVTQLGPNEIRLIRDEKEALRLNGFSDFNEEMPFSFVRFFPIGRRLIVTGMKAPVFQHFPRMLRARYEHLIDMQLLVLEEYARKYHFAEICIVSATTMMDYYDIDRRMWPVIHAIYDKPTRRLGYRSPEKLTWAQSMKWKRWLGLLSHVEDLLDSGYFSTKIIGGAVHEQNATAHILRGSHRGIFASPPKIDTEALFPSGLLPFLRSFQSTLRAQEIHEMAPYSNLANEAAQLVIQHYTADPQKAAHLARRLKKAQIARRGESIRLLSQRKCLVEISELGTQRFFDVNGRWILTIDPRGTVIDELAWDKSNEFRAGWTRQADGHNLFFTPSTNDRVVYINRQVGKSRNAFLVQDVRDENDNVRMEFSPGLDFNHMSKVPYATLPLDVIFAPSHLSGVGVSVMRWVALLAKDQGNELTYVGNDVSSPPLTDAMHRLYNTLREVARLPAFVTFAAGARMELPDSPEAIFELFHDFPNSFHWTPEPPEVVFMGPEHVVYLRDRNVQRIYFRGDFYLAPELQLRDAIGERFTRKNEIHRIGDAYQLLAKGVPVVSLDSSGNSVDPGLAKVGGHNWGLQGLLPIPILILGMAFPYSFWQNVSDLLIQGLRYFNENPGRVALGMALIAVLSEAVHRWRHRRADPPMMRQQGIPSVDELLEHAEELGISRRQLGELIQGSWNLEEVEGRFRKAGLLSNEIPPFTLKKEKRQWRQLVQNLWFQIAPETPAPYPETTFGGLRGSEIEHAKSHIVVHGIFHPETRKVKSIIHDFVKACLNHKRVLISESLFKIAFNYGYGGSLNDRKSMPLKEALESAFSPWMRLFAIPLDVLARGLLTPNKRVFHWYESGIRRYPWFRDVFSGWDQSFDVENPEEARPVARRLRLPMPLRISAAKYLSRNKSVPWDELGRSAAMAKEVLDFVESPNPGSTWLGTSFMPPPGVPDDWLSVGFEELDFSHVHLLTGGIHELEVAWFLTHPEELDKFLADLKYYPSADPVHSMKIVHKNGQLGHVETYTIIKQILGGAVYRDVTRSDLEKMAWVAYSSDAGAHLWLGEGTNERLTDSLGNVKEGVSDSELYIVRRVPDSKDLEVVVQDPGDQERFKWIRSLWRQLKPVSRPFSRSFGTAA